MKNLPYKRVILDNIPRLLSQEDRNRLSPTYGCFDRSYWHLRFVTDFPSAHYQEISLILALLYKNEFEGNIYHKNRQIFEWAVAGLLFWTKIQNKDGSFNEAYPNEHSFVTTTFSTYSISEAYLLLVDSLSEDQKSILTTAIKRAGNWLLKYNDLVVSNHQAGAVAALYDVYLISGEQKYCKEAKKKLDLLLKQQDLEGWLPEYEGADLGYLSMSIDYLAKYYQRTKDVVLLEKLRKAVDFMAYFIAPDGSFGGGYSSRGVEYLCPHGIEVLSHKIDSASYILSRFYRGWERGTILTPLNMDDRYTGFFVVKYLQAFLEHKDFSEKNTEFQLIFIKNFNNAKLLVTNQENYHLVVGCDKGGVVKIVDKNSLKSYSNNGIIVLLKNGKVVTSQRSNKHAKSSLFTGNSGQKLELSTPFCLVNHSLPLKKFLVPLRVFNYTFGRSDWMMRFFSRFLRGYKMKKKEVPIELRRVITFDKESISIEDTIRKNPKLRIERISIANRCTSTITDSANYYDVSHLNEDLISRGIEIKILKKIEKNNVVRLSQRVNFKPFLKAEPYLIEG